MTVVGIIRSPRRMPFTMTSWRSLEDVPGAVVDATTGAAEVAEVSVCCACATWTALSRQNGNETVSGTRMRKVKGHPTYFFQPMPDA